MCKLKFWQKTWPLSGIIIFALFLGTFLAGCARPQRVDPVVKESLAHTLEQAYPDAQNKFALGPFGGEMGIENLVEFDLPEGSTNRKIHLIGRDFLQTEDEHTRLLTFLNQKGNHPQFLAKLAFPHHTPWIDSIQAEAVHIACLNGKIPTIRLQLRQGEQWQSGWLVMLPYVLQHPWLQYRMVWLLAIGDERTAQDILQDIANLPAITQNLLIPNHDSVNQTFFGNPCRL
jgi:hypothetical protein